jgi:hypothetical protein
MTLCPSPQQLHAIAPLKDPAVAAFDRLGAEILAGTVPAEQICAPVCVSVRSEDRRVPPGEPAPGTRIRPRRRPRRAPLSICRDDCAQATDCRSHSTQALRPTPDDAGAYSCERRCNCSVDLTSAPATDRAGGGLDRRLRDPALRLLCGGA